MTLTDLYFIIAITRYQCYNKIIWKRHHVFIIKCNTFYNSL